VSRGQIPRARESLPRTELLDRGIIRLDMPENGNTTGQGDHRGAAQVSVRQNHLKPK
jgi:hypothetical protein